MSSDTQTHSHTIKPPTAGVQLVGHTRIRSSAIPATPDDGTIQGRRILFLQEDSPALFLDQCFNRWMRSHCLFAKQTIYIER